MNTYGWFCILLSCLATFCSAQNNHTSEPKALPIALPCTAGPKIMGIGEISETGARVQFHGENIFGLSYEIQKEGRSIHSGQVVPASNVIRIHYPNQSPGTYQLVLSGTTCTGTDQQSFTISPPAVNAALTHVSKRSKARAASRDSYELFLNTTGYGYEPDAKNGLHPDWPERIEAFRFSWGYGITGIRLCVRWNDWEPTEGQFTREGLQKVIAYCRTRGLKLSVFFWPWRMQGDGFIPEGHQVTGHRGRPHELDGTKRMGSLASEPVNAKLYRAVHALAQELSAYEGGYYMSIGTASAEEFTNPVIGEGSGGPKEITGFEPVFQEGFRLFRQERGQPYVRPTIREWDAGAALDMSDEAGKDFARYISLNLTRYFQNFAQAVKEGSQGKLLTVFMYPDVGSPQNAWYLHANLGQQAAEADALFGTDGIDRTDNHRKLLVNAVNLGMEKISMNEYDPIDLGSDGPYCSGIDLTQMNREFQKSYTAGVQVIHLAMSFCPAEIKGMEPHLRNLHRRYFNKPYLRPQRRVTPVSITPAFWQGEEIFAPSWTGNNYLKPINDDFWGEIRKD
ncbi:hypothetical protein [Arundinibacter roseus]|uniref:Uncharacterized protein n=1 Tax=Arundinibacter roseus TaxID=2070510 RepID=A0A4R4K0P8_9BACT|nr:hypothetical protein [Arundinibacter roseus]TDB60062.1 hypothetical protein EZE20_21565 [Arundinibacter roseus]